MRNRERWLDTSGQFTTHLVEQRDEGNEHESRTEHRVQEELERCVLTIFATPHTDHEVHRQQHHFEEHEEQDEVLRNESSRHTCLQDEHQDEECLGVAGRRNAVPRVDHHQNRDDHRQEVERQAHSVKTDRIVTRNDFDPLGVCKELQLASLVIVELGERINTHSQGCERGHKSYQLVELFFCLGDDQHDNHAD